MRKVSSSIAINNCIYEGELSANNFRKSQIRKFSENRSLRLVDNKCGNLQIFICGPKVFCDMRICLIFANLKGRCHEIFDFCFFHESVSPSPWVYHLGRFEFFFENSRRYSQLKVHHWWRWHRWQMEKIFNQKNFNYFVGVPLGCRVNIQINICLQVHFKVSAAWYCSHYLLPVNLPPGVVDSGGVRWLADISVNFRKFEMTLMLFSRHGGRWFMKKTWSKKSRDTLPLKLP